jgi:Ca2+-binding RTX toxin-like protein
MTIRLQLPAAETVVNSSLPGHQTSSRIAALTDGGYIVAWGDRVLDTDEAIIRAQRFDAAGSRVGAETVVASTNAPSQIDVAVTGLADGGFALAWGNRLTATSTELRSQRFGQDGAPVGVAERVNATAGTHEWPSVAALPDGGYVVVWQGLPGTGESATARARVFGPSGSNEFRLDPDGSLQALPDVVGTSTGFLVSWNELGLDRSIKTRAFATDGTALGADVSVSVAPTTSSGDVFSPALTKLPTGGFVATWLSREGSFQQGTSTIKARILDQNGRPLGAEIAVATAPDGLFVPEVAAAPDGGFVVVWEALGSSRDVVGRHFAPDGTPRGASFTVDTRPTGDVGNPDIVMLPDRLVAVWSGQSEFSGQGSGSDIQARQILFASDQTGTNAPETLRGYTGEDRLDASGGDDTLIGGAGNDALFGGNGRDIAVLSGSSLDYALAPIPGRDGQYGITDLRAGSPDGRDSLSGIELLRFTDGTYAFRAAAPSEVAVNGTAGADWLFGDARDNTFSGNGGGDVFVGGEGRDTVLIGDYRTLYTVTGNAARTTFTGPDQGANSATGVEALSFLDGRLVYDPSDRAAVVYRMYDSAFDRAPDPLGFNGWISALERGANAETIALSFTGSPEFQQTYGSLSNRGFVEQLYRNVLDREGDDAGVADWTGRLDAGTLTRGQVLVGFSESPEHVEKLRAPVEAGLWDANEAASSVARLYYAALERAPDASGLTGWTRAVEGGTALGQVADGFAFSAEFQNRYGALNDEGYVRQLYSNVLDREADAGGLSNWLDVLASGRGDRGDVLVGFSESTEFQIKTLPLVDGGILLA